MTTDYQSAMALRVTIGPSSLEACINSFVEAILAASEASDATGDHPSLFPPFAPFSLLTLKLLY